MRCPACQAENPDQHRFCEQCGALLEARCAQCAAPVRAGARFCGACGAPLGAAPAPPAPAPSPARRAGEPPGRFVPYTPKHLADKILKGRAALEGERRQVTVLFADVAGFTGLAERLDPEDVHQIIDRCFELITAEVHRLEGTINQYTGDGVMALFGAPIGHEDGPRSASMPPARGTSSGSRASPTSSAASTSRSTTSTRRFSSTSKGMRSPRRSSPGRSHGAIRC
jgi:hypothetical protein